MDASCECASVRRRAFPPACMHVAAARLLPRRTLTLSWSREFCGLEDRWTHRASVRLSAGIHSIYIGAYIVALPIRWATLVRHNSLPPRAIAHYALRRGQARHLTSQLATQSTLLKDRVRAWYRVVQILHLCQAAARVLTTHQRHRLPSSRRTCKAHRSRQQWRRPRFITCSSMG